MAMERKLDVYRTDSAERREEKIRRYLPLVKREAERLAMAIPPHIEKDDLIGSGFVGLMEALEKFNPQKGVPFEQYARRRIRGAMLDELRRLSWAPRSFFNKLRRLEKAVAELSANLGREPTVNELAEKLSLSEKAVEQIFAEINKKSLLSLEELLFYNLESRLESGEPMGKDAGPEERLLQKERKELLARAIDTLSERERLILALYYYEKLTLKEIAGVMALSAPRISQLHARALIKMRNFLKKQG